MNLNTEQEIIAVIDRLNEEHCERVRPWINQLEAIRNNQPHVIRVDRDVYNQFIQPSSKA